MYHLRKKTPTTKHLKGGGAGPGRAREKRQRGEYDLKHYEVLKEIIYFKRKMKTYQDNI